VSESQPSGPERPVPAEGATDAAREAEAARLREALAKATYSLGLHQSSLARELGSAQVEALRSWRGALALPGRLWRIVRGRRRDGAPERSREDLDAIAARAAATYAREGFAAADAEASSEFLTVPQRAYVYTELAKRVFAADPGHACRFGAIADALEPQPYRTLWLAFLRFDAGELEAALDVLGRVPPDFSLSNSEANKAEQLRGLVRMRHRMPQVPAPAAAPAQRQERVLYVAATALPHHVSGYTLRTQALLKALAAKGVDLACLTRPGYPNDRADRQSDDMGDAVVDGVAYLRAPGHRARTAPDAYLAQAADAIARIAVKQRATILHAASNHENALPALIAARRLGLPFVYEVRGLWEYTAASRVPGWESRERFALERDLETLVAREADHVFAINEELAAELRRRGVPEDRISLAPNAAAPVAGDVVADRALREALGLPDEAFVVGFAGSLVPYEGLDDLLDAAALLAATEPRLHVLLVGEGECRADLQAQAQRLGIADRVHFTGRVEPAEVPRHLALCDCVALPRKPQRVCELVAPLKPLEAMALGRPLLVSNVAPLRRLVEDGSTGRIHAAGDSASLARCLADLIGDPEATRRMGEAARRYVETERRWDQVADEIVALYRALPARRGRTGTADAPPRRGAPTRLDELRVVAIMDEFTQACFEPDCVLTPLSLADWRTQVDEAKPHLLLVESAWHGLGSQWERKIPQCSKDLRDLVAYCRSKGIPTAFWNKEDPVHYGLFLRTATLFDVVFTTDIDRLKDYRRELGHSRVHLLPFAAQPRSHNPVEKFERRDAFCFAGSYYVKYPERRADFDALVDAASSLRPVEIYDRNHGKDYPGLAFPERYQPMVQGGLPFAEIDRAYKGYRYGITINTVKQSQSMFARRAFELLACNTLTISNFSRGLRAMLGELVPSSDNGASLRGLVAPLLADEARLRRFRLAGLRKVLTEHTYAHRLAWLAGHVLGEPLAPPRSRVVVLAHVADQDAVAAAIAAYDAQQWPEKSLALVVAEGFVPEVPLDRRDLRLVGAFEASRLDPAQAWPEAWIARMDPRDHYGPAYLTDLALVDAYARVDFAAKAAFHRLENGTPVATGLDQAYREVAPQPMRRSLVRTSALAGTALSDLLDGDACPPVGPGLAIDEFNYCADGAGQAVQATVDDLLLDTGLAMAGLLEGSEHGALRDAADVDVDDLPGFGAAELRVLFPPSSHAEGRLQVVHSGDAVELHSRLEEGQHGYVYASRWFRVEELADDGFARFQLQTSAGLYVTAALVYHDGAKQRISHAIVYSDTNQALPVPAGTEWIRFGLRVLGSGDTRLVRLVRGAVPPRLDQIVGRGKALLLTKDYPRYDDLYRYGFVHRRVLAYAREGLRVDVFRFSGQPLAFDEFQGVDVVAGQAEHLALMLAGGEYRCLLVHAMTPQMWEAVKPLLGRLRVIVWVHGAEIQPWYRRSFDQNEAERDQARRASEQRRAMWFEVLAHPHPNLRLVFVSRHLAREALDDLGLSLPQGQFALIPNFVDGDLFRFEPKPAAQRLKVLSIRPYSSRIYGNDLAVAAILSLSREPWFGELEFRLVGDGAMFDTLVAPLRGFANVVLEKGFLSQDRIAALHREYGVFLVPSRMDSQGVSRDEAMASGLVPVTNRVAAIPEFVDASCGWLAEPEDAEGLAEGIRRLRADPDLFQRLSAAAARQARRLSGHQASIARELALLAGEPASAPALDPGPVRRRIALYGDVNLNVTDGSAVWAASLAEVLAGADGVRTTLYLKARVRNTHILAPVLMLPGLRVVEPVGSAGQALSPDEALDRIGADDARQPYDAIVLRGLALCERASLRDQFRGRLWIYITDLPQRREDLDAPMRERLQRIVEASAVVLCQTEAFRDYLHSVLPGVAGKTRLLSPMVPEPPPAAPPPPAQGPLRLAYAGKFAPLWGIRELFAAHRQLVQAGAAIELHAFGDKIHNPPEDPGFRDEVIAALASGGALVWHGAIEREALLGELQGMHVGWAWRHADLEAHTHELSTKLLEYAICGVPPIMAGNAVNRGVFGDDYVLYADSEADAVALLGRLAREPALRQRARDQVQAVASRFTFAGVRDSLVAQGLLPAPDATGSR
jgi:glycosyltransferase involved in cell wall biosynthesis